MPSLSLRKSITAGLVAVAADWPNSKFASGYAIDASQLLRRDDFNHYFPVKGQEPFQGDDKFDTSDIDFMCDYDPKDRELAAKLWYLGGVGSELDKFVSDNSSENWLDKLQQEMWGNNPRMDCSILTSNKCNVPYDCKTISAMENGKPEYYWILEAIGTLQNVLLAFDSSTVKSTLSNLLSVDEIIKDLSLPEKHQDPTEALLFQILGGSIGAFATIAPGAKAFSAVPLLASGLFDFIGESINPSDDNNDKVERAPLEKILKNYLDKTTDHLSKTLTNAIGKGDQKSLPKSGRTEDWIYKTETAQFLASGKFLIRDLGKEIDGIIKDASKEIYKALVVNVLQQQGTYVVFHSSNSKDKCTTKTGFLNGKTSPSALWLEKGDYGIEEGCYHLAMTKDAGGPDEDMLKKLDETYGIPVDVLMKSAVQCAREGSLDEGSYRDIYNTIHNKPKSLSRCQYALTVSKCPTMTSCRPITTKDPDGKKDPKPLVVREE